MKILASDILIVDVISRYESNPAIQQLVKTFGLKPGGKAPLSRAQHELFLKNANGAKILPGGSSSNALTTLVKLMPQVGVTMLGVIGREHHDIIQQSLDEARIALLPKPSALPHIAVETAISHIVVYANGQRTIATYPGNARDLLKPSFITDPLVAAHDIVFIQGSLWQRMGWEYADTLLRKCRAQKKELWLALPTYPKFGEEKAGLFQELIRNSKLVLGNEEELARIFGGDAESAMKKLQNEPGHIVFITRSGKGATVLADGQSWQIPPPPATSIVNTLGAGDTAFAGFAAGYLKKLPPETCAKIAVALAGEKLKVDGARLADPKAALQSAAPELAKLIA